MEFTFSNVLDMISPKKIMEDIDVYKRQVLYIECRGHTLFIYTKNEECHKIYGSLKSLEEKLLVYGFIRIHKNFLVNARCVKEIGNRTVCLLDGMELDLSLIHISCVGKMAHAVRTL